LAGRQGVEPRYADPESIWGVGAEMVGGGDCHAARRDPDNLATAYDGAAGSADRRDMQARSDSYLQIELKQDFANQEALRAVAPSLPESPAHAVVRNFGWLRKGCL
jgi:hypothetical protein